MTAIRFRLNGRLCEEDGVPPTMTVLDYLRTVRRLTGTKEGCAEGDCGACTIAVIRPDDGGRTAWQAVNSCLMVVPQLDGLAVRTVEGIAGADGGLHPVQQALVDNHGSQCGFCTPGFVTAMFAWHEAGGGAGDDDIHQALAGNLCRCTGYRPIVAACRQLAAAPPAPAAAEATMPPSGGSYRQGDQVFEAPATMSELLQAAQQPQARLLGGGTDLGLLFSKDRQAPPLLVSTARVPELRQVVLTDSALEIGGAVTYRQALPHLDATFPAFADLVRRIGSPQIRALGTLAGNLATASPVGDTLPCLLALEAEVVLRSATQSRTVAMTEFIVGYRRSVLAPGEVIAAIRIPRLTAGQRFFAYKLARRFDQDIATLLGAFRLATQEDGRIEFAIAYGGMAATPARAYALEAHLAARPWNAAALAGAEAALARDFTPLGDHRGGADYRRRAAANLVRRLLLESTGAAAPLRLEAL